MTRVPSSLRRATTAAPMPAAPPVTMAVFPFKPRISVLLRNDGGRLELDLTGCVEEVGDEDHAHRRIVAPHQAAPDTAELGARGEVCRLVAAVGGDAADVLALAAGLGQDRENVVQGALELLGEIFRLENLLLVPSHLAGDEDHRSARRDAVRVADGRRPAPGLQDPHSLVRGGSGSSSQPALGCGTR